MTTCSPLGAGDGVLGVEIAAACRRVLTLDMSSYRSCSEVLSRAGFFADEISIHSGFRLLLSRSRG